MPRLTQSVPKYRKHRGSGQAVTTLGGRDFYLGPYGTRASKREYDRLIAEYLASGRSSTFGKPDALLTVTQVAIAYLKHCEAYYGNGVNSEYHRVKLALRPLRRMYGRTAANAFSGFELKAVRQSFIDVGNARSYVNAQTKRIVRAFRWAAAEGMIPPSVPQVLALIPSLRKGRTDARETDPVLPADNELVEAVLPHLPEAVADMVRLQRLTGMRPAELCSLTPGDIDRTKDVWEFRPQKHKTAYHGHQRVVFMGPRAQEILLKYLARDPAMHCFRPCDSEAKRRAELHAERKTPLSCGNKPGTNRKRKPKKQPGEAYDPRSYASALRRACDRAFPWPKLGKRKIRDLSAAERSKRNEWSKQHRFSPNQLRHLRATEVRHQFGLEHAQVALGHARADVTQIYAERDFAKAAEVARQIG